MLRFFFTALGFYFHFGPVKFVDRQTCQWIGTIPEKHQISYYNVKENSLYMYSYLLGWLDCC